MDPLAPVTAVISGKMNESANKELAKQSNKYNKEYMALSHMYEMASARKSAAMTKQGLQAAGLSPALMSQGLFAPATAPTSPTASSPNFAPYDIRSSGISDLLQLSNLQAQTENIKAQTKKTQLENESTENENDISQGLGFAALEKMAADLPDTPENLELKARYQALADMVKNRGAVAALASYAHMLDERETYNSRVIQNRLQKAVTEYQLDEKHGKNGRSIIADMAELPSAEFAQYWSTQMYYLRYAEKLQKDSQLSEEERNLRLSQIKLTDEQIANLKAVTKRINDTNIMKIAEDVGNGKAHWSKLLAALGILILGNTSAHF